MREAVMTDDQRILEFRVALRAVVDFATTPQFTALLAEMFSLSPECRHEFVDLVVMNSHELNRRRICLVDGIDLQKSWFADGRPTLFCITKKLAPGAGWKVATVTIDNPINEGGGAIWVPDEIDRISDAFVRPPQAWTPVYQ